MNLFAAVEMAPSDPILGLNEKFNADTNPNKVNLGVGVYFGEDGKMPLLECVKLAEKRMTELPTARNYLPIDGIAAYDKAVKELVFGAASEPLSSERVVTIQGLGGTGALKVGADFLHMVCPQAQVLISDPSWDNHRGIFENAGFTVQPYAYYHSTRKCLDFDGMLASLKAAPVASIVVLHVCCHNPTGYDLSLEQWDQVIQVVKARRHTPFLDMAYQGFAQGIAADGAVVHKFVAAGLQFLISTSFSKSFNLYGERVGALSVLCADKTEAQRVLSQLKIRIRTNYSNPPTHGAAVVTTVLNQPELRALWETELTAMRQRIKEMRLQLVAGLKASGCRQNFEFITQQTGMFSFTGLSPGSMMRLRSEFGIYGTDSGRICVAALNHNNLAYVCRAIASISNASPETADVGNRSLLHT